MQTENKNLGKPQIAREILHVKEKFYLTPHYIRVVLEGNVESYSIARIGDNNKIVLPNSENQVVFPESEIEKKEVKIRTYTTRFIDFVNNTLTIDFVAHGDEGPASAWVIRANVGDPLGVLMKYKPKPLFLPAENYLLVGDHTALPVVAAILEQLPKDAKGKAILEVYSKEDVLELDKPENVALDWIYNTEPGKISLLPNLVKKEKIEGDSNFVFVAVEYNSANEIQSFLRNHEKLNRSDWQTYAYWKYGQAEDSSSSDRIKSMKKEE